MNARRLFSALCLSVLCLAAASPAFALANRVFVSARSGNDANSCDNVNTPCKTFVGAVAQLNPDGEAIVLDSGGYGPVTITQGVTLEAPAGVTAFIHPPSGDAITVNAPGATVVLRGLVLNTGSGNGITVSSVGTLIVENCFITGFSFDGIRVVSGGIAIVVKNTDITKCAQGLAVRNTSGTVNATIDHTHLDSNSFGYLSIGNGGSSKVSMTNSTASHNDQEGMDFGFNDTRVEKVAVESCVVSNNGLHGLLADAIGAGSEIAVSNCTVTNNGGTGLVSAAGSVLTSRGNNTVRLNGTNTSGVITPFSGT